MRNLRGAGSHAANLEFFYSGFDCNLFINTFFLFTEFVIGLAKILLAIAPVVSLSYFSVMTISKY